MLEDFYTEARSKGIIFSRFDLEQTPEVTGNGQGLEVTFVDHVLQRPVKIPADAVILSAATLAADTEHLATQHQTPRNAFGFFIEAHAKLRPVDFSSEGIYLCGTAHSPKLTVKASPRLWRPLPGPVPFWPPPASAWVGPWPMSTRRIARRAWSAS